MGGHLCNDWRVTNQMNYLFRARLIKTTFSESSHSNHEHCEFCFAKFGNAEGLLQSGYCTLDKYHWVCDECYRDFRAQFEWTVLDESHDSPSELR